MIWWYLIDFSDEEFDFDPDLLSPDLLDPDLLDPDDHEVDQAQAPSENFERVKKYIVDSYKAAIRQYADERSDKVKY